MTRENQLQGLAHVSYQGPLPPNVLSKLTPQNIDQLVDAYVTQQKAMPEIVKIVLTQDDVRKTKRERAILAGIGLILGTVVTVYSIQVGFVKDALTMATTFFGLSFGVVVGKELIDWIFAKLKS
ncbi:MAG: hypothetical protein OHK0011_00840 [Turneriella sp.]